MKQILILLLLCVVRVNAQNAVGPLVDWVNPASLAYYNNYQIMFTNVPALNTNMVSLTNRVDGDLFQTYQIWQNTNLNGCSWAIDYSLDSSNFCLGSTNILGASAADQCTNIEAKWGFSRVRLFATNFVGNVDYLGGR
jgi:hypothetical protein